MLYIYSGAVSEGLSYQCLLITGCRAVAARFARHCSPRAAMSAALLLLLVNCLRLTAGQDEVFTCTPQKTFPHPLDCTRYYYCDNNNIQQVFYCPPGLHYNPETEVCDLPDSSPCPYVPGQPSAATLPSDEQPPEVSSLPGDEQFGQAFVSSIPLTRQSQFSPVADLELPFAPTLPEFGPSSLSPVPSDDGDTVSGQSFISFSPGRGGPVFSQPDAEDRNDDVRDIVYENKTEDTSDSYGNIFTVLQNFEKTLEEGRQKEEGETTSGFVDVKRQAPAGDATLESNDTTQASLAIETAPEEVKAESATSEDSTGEFKSEATTEKPKTEGRCSADLDFFGRSAPTATTEDDKNENSFKEVSITTEKGDQEGKDGGSGNGEPKINIPDNSFINWPFISTQNLTLTESDSGVEVLDSSNSPTVKSINSETENVTEEERSTLNFLNINETSPLNHTEISPSEALGGTIEETFSSKPEKAEEIEEAKGTIIFESHSEEEEVANPGIPDHFSSVVLQETKIL